MSMRLKFFPECLKWDSINGKMIIPNLSML